ncbi:MAG: hypothetical protein K2J77_00665 [Oscillospiraceae bacterium]|nr:hypothetical protein [Oscillospiraceae bacterium]
MTEKPRKIAFTIIAALLALITIWISAGYCLIITSPIINTDEIDKMYVDGSDCTPIVQMGAAFFNFVLTMAFTVIFIAVEAVVFPITWGIFRAVSLKKNPAVTQEEFTYSRRVFLITSLGALGVSFVVMIVSAVIAKSGISFSALFFCWLNPLLMWGIYISKLKKQTQ